MELVVVKLGGSLITNKLQQSSARMRVLERLCREIALAREMMTEALLVSHGSGSFGHVAAARFKLEEGLKEPAQLPGVATTQDQAHRLHRIVAGSLGQAGVAAFSLAPSSFAVADGGRPAVVHVEPFRLALEAGLVPVTFGDVVLDRSRGASICSTETVLSGLLAPLAEAGWPVRRVLWMGAPDGVLDERGRTIPEVAAENAEAAIAAAGAAAGQDVTGGMRHRLETALEMALLGVESWILNGMDGGVLERALRGERVPGTKVRALGGR
ncbi:MAG: isopentenyl phosphate kinase [Thermoanaerobaculia bacterium]|nr:isopentenyl phosphate kinase [Thermoanaerobaculia bacterium]